MIRLTEIQRNNGKIQCEAYVEDCDSAITLSLDEKTAELSEVELPKGYEWCKSHIAHARKFLRTLIGADQIPAQRVIMWY